jgi:hypothetical protein
VAVDQGQGIFAGHVHENVVRVAAKASFAEDSSGVGRGASWTSGRAQSCTECTRT